MSIIRRGMRSATTVRCTRGLVEANIERLVSETKAGGLTDERRDEIVRKLSALEVYKEVLDWVLQKPGVELGRLV